MTWITYKILSERLEGELVRLTNAKAASKEYLKREIRTLRAELLQASKAAKTNGDSLLKVFSENIDLKNHATAIQFEVENLRVKQGSLEEQNRHWAYELQQVKTSNKLLMDAKEKFRAENEDAKDLLKRSIGLNEIADARLELKKAEIERLKVIIAALGGNPEVEP